MSVRRIISKFVRRSGPNRRCAAESSSFNTGELVLDGIAEPPPLLLPSSPAFSRRSITRIMSISANQKLSKGISESKVNQSLTHQILIYRHGADSAASVRNRCRDRGWRLQTSGRFLATRRSASRSLPIPGSRMASLHCRFGNGQSLNCWYS